MRGPLKVISYAYWPKKTENLRTWEEVPVEALQITQIYELTNTSNISIWGPINVISDAYLKPWQEVPVAAFQITPFPN